MSDVANLVARLSLAANAASFSAGDRMIAKTKKGVDELEGAFQDKGGRWRASSGRFLTSAEKRAKGIKNIGDEAGKAKKKSSGLNDSLETMAKGVAFYFGAQFVGKSLIGFNANIEDSKNQIAGMLALARHTDLNDELKNAGDLYDRLQQRAAKLPGTTAEYVAMAGMITQPIIDAGLSMKDLEDLTVDATVAARAFRIDAGAAARDVDQALRGQFHSNDAFTGKVLGSIGYKGEAGRRKYNALSAKQRADELKRGLGSKQIGQLGEAQGKTFTGRLSTLQDTAQQFAGRIGQALFGELGDSLEKLNKYLDENSEKLKEIANDVGSVLAGAFKIGGDVIAWFSEHLELAGAILTAFGVLLTAWAIKAAAAWLIGLGPIALAAAAITAIIYLLRNVSFDDVVEKLTEVWDAIGDFLTETLPNAIVSAFRWAWDEVVKSAKAAGAALGELPVVKQLFWLTRKAAQGAAYAYTRGKGGGGVADAGYETAVAGGFEGTEADWNEQLRRIKVDGPAAAAPSRAVSPTSTGPVSIRSETNIKIDGAGLDEKKVAELVAGHVEEANNKMLIHARESVG